MTKEQKQQAQDVATKLFSMLGVNAPFELTATDEGIEILLETEENGMLIGYHGETLEALQLILSLAIAKQVGEFIRVSLEVGEYKKKRMEYLQQLVAQTKEQVMQENIAVPLPNLKSWERRYVHTLLQADTDVMSESSGEGRDRILTIYPKQ